MFGLVLGALWRRRAQAVLLFVLAVVATTGASAAPVYIVAGVQSLAAAAADGAASPERVVSVSDSNPLGASPATDLNAFRAAAVRELNLPDFDVISGANLPFAVGKQTGQLAYRDGLCDHLTLRGACPAAPGEIVLDESFASRLGVAVHDPLSATVDGADTPVTWRVVGLYRAVNPNDPYWGRASDRPGAGGERLDASDAYTVLSTFASVGRAEAAFTVDLVATARAFRERDPQLHALAYEQGAIGLRARGVIATSSLRALADRIFADQQLVYVGVAVGAGELLLMCWFALFLAVSQTGADRRADVGLLKMRGARRRDIWRLLAGQSLIPLAAGGAVGLVAGPLLAEWIAGPVEGAAIRRAVGLAVVASTLLAVVGAVAAALIAERRMLGESVASLGRGVAGARRGWRAGIFDGLVVVAAVAAVFQVKTGVGVGELDLLAPILTTLAVGVLSARLIPLVAAKVGRQALRSGRLGLGLAALHLARRPGTARVLGLVTVVVAVLSGTAFSWSASDRARHDRAVFEVGDDRVLTVRPASPVGPANPTNPAGPANLMSPASLVAAVRAADPEGRYAMAAIQENSVTPVLAVDASRLGAVVPGLAAYGVGDWRTLATALRPTTPSPVTVGPGGLTLDATWAPPAGDGAAAPMAIVATLAGDDGLPLTVPFGPLTVGRHRYVAPQPSCDPHCRLVSVALSSAASGAKPGPGAVATVHALTGLADAGPLTDRTRWRGDVVLGAQVPRITAGSGGLSLTVAGETLASGSGFTAAAFVLDAPTPVPVVSSRDLHLALVPDPRLSLTDPTVQPVRVVAEVPSLPRIGRGVLVDLGYADGLARAHDGGIMQVWLADGTPQSVVDHLTGAGVTIVSDESVHERLDVLSAQGPPIALRFLLLVALVGVLLSVISFAVMGAVERRPRQTEFAALRRQGLRARVVRRVAVGGYTVLVAGAVLIGFVTATGLAVFVPGSLPVFGDGWHAFALPGAPWYVLVVASASVAVVLAGVAAVVAAVLTGAVRRAVEAS